MEFNINDMSDISAILLNDSTACIRIDDIEKDEVKIIMSSLKKAVSKCMDKPEPRFVLIKACYVAVELINLGYYNYDKIIKVFNKAIGSELTAEDIYNYARLNNLFLELNKELLIDAFKTIIISNEYSVIDCVEYIEWFKNIGLIDKINENSFFNKIKNGEDLKDIISKTCKKVRCSKCGKEVMVKDMNPFTTLCNDCIKDGKDENNLGKHSKVKKNKVKNSDIIEEVLSTEHIFLKYDTSKLATSDIDDIITTVVLAVTSKEQAHLILPKIAAILRERNNKNTGLTYKKMVEAINNSSEYFNLSINNIQSYIQLHDYLKEYFKSDKDKFELTRYLYISGRYGIKTIPYYIAWCNKYGIIETYGASKLLSKIKEGQEFSICIKELETEVTCSCCGETVKLKDISFGKTICKNCVNNKFQVKKHGGEEGHAKVVEIEKQLDDKVSNMKSGNTQKANGSKNYLIFNDNLITAESIVNRLTSLSLDKLSNDEIESIGNSLGNIIDKLVELESAVSELHKTNC